MENKPELPFFTLVLMISFASVNAVFFTPALPAIATFFEISEKTAQYTISLFLIGYALGQLLYGPLANRYGRKKALYIGILLQIIASLGCAFSSVIHAYPLLLISRFVVALGSGVGLKMTFTLINERYEPKVASQKIAYLILAFAVTPGLGVGLGGIVNTYFGWMSCFIVGMLYGMVLLVLVAFLSNVETHIDVEALKWAHLKKAYGAQFQNKQLLVGGLLMGSTTCFFYLFASLGPFIAINMMGMSSKAYGISNIIPSLGLVIGALSSAQLVKKYALPFLIKIGIKISFIGVLSMVVAVSYSLSPLWSLFFPMMIIEIGLSFILANASTMAMSGVDDKAHGAAVMSFVNMGSTTLVVLSMEWFFRTQSMLLPVVYLILWVTMIPLYYSLCSNSCHYKNPA